MTLPAAAIGAASGEPEQLFENAVSALQPPAAPRSKALEAKVEALEKQVAKKDEVIAWVTEEHVKLKKTLGEP